MGFKPAMKCPCLYSSVAPICSADTETMRIPTPDQLARGCLTDQHRRCEIFRRFLGLPVGPLQATARRDAEARRRGPGWSENTIYLERGT